MNDSSSDTKALSQRDHPRSRDEILRDAQCARCGYSLRGLTETRCPECGKDFSLDRLCAQQELSSVELFEYQWTKRPVRAWCGTVRSALLPQRFWQRVELEHDPYRKSLWLYSLLCVALAPFVLVLLDAASRSVLTSMFNRSFNAADLGSRMYTLALGAGLVWLVAFLTYQSLRVFHSSLLKHGVRKEHLLRLIAYSLSWYACLSVVHFVGWWGMKMSFRIFRHTWRFSTSEIMRSFNETLFVLAVVTWWISLFFGVRHYLKLKRGWLLLMVSQVVVGLILANLYFLGAAYPKLYAFSYGMELTVHSIFFWIGEPGLFTLAR